MVEYDDLYSAGERALNEASRDLTRAEVERMMGDASSEMRQTTGGDLTRFDRVRERYAAQCADLLAPSAP